jgi:subtilisin family serine protease
MKHPLSAPFLPWPRAVATIAACAMLAACGGGADPDEPAASASEAAAQPLALSAAGGTPTPGWADIVVQLKAEGDVKALAARHRLSVVDQFGRRPIWRLRHADKRNQAALLQALRGETTVRYAELNAVQESPVARHNSVWAIGNPNGQHNSVWAIGRPGDYTAQWAPQAMRLSLAHASTAGQGVRVAVLDTGVDASHPALVLRMARNGSGHVLGRDFVDEDADAREEGRPLFGAFGHGTHVAGLVALAAPGARLMPVRVLDPGGRGNAWVLAEALAWAVDPDGDPNTDDGAHVINLSLGGTAPTDLLKTAVALATCDFGDDDDDDHPGFAADLARCARGHGAVVVAAAGNSGSDTELQYPAAEQVKGSLAVAAGTAERRLAGFSNFGSWILGAAPGQGVTSTVPGGGYGVWSGTSMASPLAAGTAALVLTRPSPNPQPGRGGLRQWTAEDVVKRLLDRSAVLCAASQRAIDAAAAVRDEPAPDPGC